MSEAKKKVGKKAKRKESSSPKSAKSGKSGKSGKSRNSSSPGTPKEEPEINEIAGNSCFRHHKEVKYFCEYHEEVLCEDCLVSPPYTTSQKKILSIEEAYRKRFTAAYHILNSRIFPKKHEINSQISKITNQLDEIREVKLAIEKDMKNEFSAMNERLNSSYGTKIALLEYDMIELQSDLERINYLTNSIQSANSDIQAFLSRYTEIKDTADLVLAKPFRTEIEVDPNTLPKELVDIRENVLKYPAYYSLVAAKDELIWKLTHEISETGKVDESTQKELSEWAKLTEKFSMELNKYKMVCEYCSVFLDNISVNSNCSRNSGSRHYFIKA